MLRRPTRSWWNRSQFIIDTLIRSPSLSSSSTTYKVTSSSSSVSRRKQRRWQTRPLPLLTLREQLRSVPDQLSRNKHKNDKERSLVERGGELLDVAESRINWLRNKVFSVWNSTYQNGNSSTAGAGTAAAASTPGGTAGAASVSTIVIQERINSFKQYEVIMDLRWWMWNVAFALMPAFVVTFYCEVYGKHAMYAYHQKVELSQMKRVMGQEWCDKHAAQILQIQKERDMDLSDRLVKGMRDLSSLTFHQLYDLYVATVARGTDTTAVTAVATVPDVASETILVGQVTEPEAQRSVLTNETTPRQDNASSNASSQSTRLHLNEQQEKEEVEPPLEYTGDKTIDALIRKVRELEVKLSEQQQLFPPGQEASRSADAAAMSSIDDRIRRVQQSGIGNRVEDAAVAKWEKILAEKSDRAKDDKNSNVAYNVYAFIARQVSNLVDQVVVQQPAVSTVDDDAVGGGNGNKRHDSPPVPTNINNNRYRGERSPTEETESPAQQQHQQPSSSLVNSSSKNIQTDSSADAATSSDRIINDGTSKPTEQQQQQGLVGWLQKQMRRPTDR